MATLWECVKNVFDDHQDRDSKQEINWTQEQAYLKGVTDRSAREEKVRENLSQSSIVSIANSLNTEAMVVRELWRNDRLWNYGQREEHFEGRSRGMEDAINRFRTEAALKGIVLPEMSAGRNMREQVERAVEVIELSGQKDRLSREGSAGALTGFSAREQEFAEDYRRMDLNPETRTEMAKAILGYGYRSKEEQAAVSREVNEILARDPESARHVEAMRKADVILGYGFRDPEVRERIDNAMDSERARLRDDGMDPVKAWTAAASNLMKRLDHEGYEKPQERAVQARTRHQRDEMELSF